MATEERVDKNWQQRELDQFSTNAILGTLAHYGVQTDEKAFIELALTEYPIGIAHRWHEGWKGKGQFLKFPVAAAEELWHRLLPGQVAPADIALAVINLLKTLDGVLGKKKDEGMLETRFKVVENYVAKVPPAAADSTRRDAFEVEVMYAMGDEWAQVLDAMGAALAKQGERAHAERLTTIEEALFPVRAGTARALMRAAAGENAEAKAELDRLAADATKPADVHIAVVDAFIDLSYHPEAKALLLKLLADASTQREMERLSNLVDRVSRLAPLLPKEEGRELAKAFEAAFTALKE